MPSELTRLLVLTVLIGILIALRVEAGWSLRPMVFALLLGWLGGFFTADQTWKYIKQRRDE
jgi:uncharacterized protein YneF (UPF0154 family)